ncbi:MAG TPA: DUF2891 domain-containing protein [Kofleriaceae bacterium]|jgi:hypothetical protein|nr:DUF2891 domain-containing protein [Kofleriaceae bacterium]
MPIPTDQANHFARLARGCIQRELPNVIQHVINGPDDVRRPRELHPAFYGCLDWHSAVHGHWMLVRLLRTVPGLADAAQIRAALDDNLTADNLAAEAAYFAGAHRQSFERTYGWAWLVQLAAELHGWDDAGARRWSENLRPLTETIVLRYLTFLPKQSYPIRTGVHPNTAFGLALALDYARATGHGELAGLLVERATTYYAADRDAPAAWEPGGEDFLSPALSEADLMRRVLPPADFADWLHGFLPRGLPPSLARPAIVSDRSDGKLAHLDGLNLSRAWCLRAVASALPAGDPLRAELALAGDVHATAGLAHVATGDYMGEHWLASFAVYLLGVTRSPS